MSLGNHLTQEASFIAQEPSQNSGGSHLGSMWCPVLPRWSQSMSNLIRCFHNDFLTLCWWPADSRSARLFLAWHKHRELGRRSLLCVGRAGFACGWRD